MRGFIQVAHHTLLKLKTKSLGGFSIQNNKKDLAKDSVSLFSVLNSQLNAGVKRFCTDSELKKRMKLQK